MYVYLHMYMQLCSTYVDKYIPIGIYIFMYFGIPFILAYIGWIFITYTPDANFNGSASFVFRVSDGNGSTITNQTYTITVRF